MPGPPGLGSGLCWRLLLVCWLAVTGFTEIGFAPPRWGPVSDCQRGYRGRSNAQSIQITHWSGGHACDLEGALPGMTIVSLTF